MNVYFRADSSLEIGTGHVMRCLALAETLKSKDVRVGFICRDLPGNLSDYIEGKGFRVIRLRRDPGPAAPSGPAGGGPYAGWLGVSERRDGADTVAALSRANARPDWMIVDHYVLGRDWETGLRPHVRRMMAIDDLPGRGHDCDILLDQDELGAAAAPRPVRSLPAVCKVLSGPAFALLRPEFAEARRTLRERNGALHEVLVCFGGIDAANETLKAMNALAQIKSLDIHVRVIAGKNNPHLRSIQDRTAHLPNFDCLHQTEEMAQLMSMADLAIGAGGISVWERCCLGLPSVVTILADNQAGVVEELGRLGVLLNMGHKETVTESAYVAALLRLDEPKLRDMARKSLDSVDGQGCDRVAAKLLVD